jgi:hypothetical protein
MRSGRRLDAGLVLLDRQIIDAEGKAAGNVDDLLFAYPQDGGAPYVTHILAGPGALGRRLGGRLGLWLESVHRRLHPEPDGGPARISFAVVKRIGNHVEVSLPKRDLPVTLFEDWVRDRFIAKIPGAEHAAE